MSERTLRFKGAIRLAELGLQKDLLQFFFPELYRNPVIIEAWSRRKVQKNFREGVWWLCRADRDGSIAADRAYRLFKELFPNLSSDNFSWHHLLRWYDYFSLRYETTEMDVNRLYFLIKHIKEYKVIVKTDCKDCRKPYLLNSDSTRVRCGICANKKNQMMSRKVELSKKVKLESETKQPEQARA